MTQQILKPIHPSSIMVIDTDPQPDRPDRSGDWFLALYLIIIFLGLSLMLYVAGRTIAIYF